MKKKRFMTAMLAGFLAASFVATSVYAYDGFNTYKGSKMVEYYGSYDSVNYPYEKLDSNFTTETVTVDGKMDAAYAASQVSLVDNLKQKEGYGIASGASTYGELRTLWNGPDLFLLVSVYDDCVVTSENTVPGATTNPAVAGETETTYINFWGMMWPVTTTKETSDSVAIAVDLYNDRTTYELDTAGIVTIDPLGKMYYYSSSNIPSLGSALGDPSHPEYMDIIKGYASAPIQDEEGNTIGYNVEVCLSLEDVNPVNGTNLAVDVKINDVNNIMTNQEENADPVYATKKSADIFWSHNQDSLYEDFDHEHTNSTDWGLITLAGWNGTDEFAYSDWSIRKILRYIDSASFAKGVYTESTAERLNRAVDAAKVIINSSSVDKVLTEQTAAELKAAFAGLRWADTRYPDPSCLPSQVTLPNTYKFFGSDKLVTNNSEWEARRAEILDLAQFYEYGYKPGYDSLTIKSASYHRKGDTYMRESQSSPGTMKEDVYKDSGASITATVTVGNVSRDFSYNIAFPSDEAVEASGHAGKRIPIVLSFDGSIQAYSDAGFAQIAVPAVCSDSRTNAYVWENRTGLFYELYPYARNGEAALKEVSNEMASAWAASLVIDMLELCEKSEDEAIRNAVSAVDIEKLAVTGFSINGKYAFVAGVFDERIDVVIPGAAGATGPSPWRYVYRGQEYDWTGTAYEGAGVDSYQVAWGTEVLANSIRHNRARETEMFRKFLTPGHFYAFEEGAYGYATRLPYDQNDLVATLAPRAIIIENTVNDYNDGCTSDCLGAEIAKSVYKNLGYDADKLVKFNLRNLKTGDPHGNDSEQRGRSAQYLDYYFFGADMDEAVSSYLSTDPYSLLISDNRTETPYDYYWGGFNTITGGKTGASGRDGWYYYTFPTASQNTSTSGNTSSGNSNNAGTDNAEEDTQVTVPAKPDGERTENAIPGRRDVVGAAPEVTEAENESADEVSSEENTEEALENSLAETTDTSITDDEEKSEMPEDETKVIEEAETPLADNTDSRVGIVWAILAAVLAVFGGFTIYFIQKKNKE